jgi:hypothetical protein
VSFGRRVLVELRGMVTLDAERLGEANQNAMIAGFSLLLPVDNMAIMPTVDDGSREKTQCLR